MSLCYKPGSEWKDLDFAVGYPCHFVGGVFAKPLNALSTHPILSVWRLQSISRLTPEPTNHLKERSASLTAFPEFKGQEYCPSCCFKQGAGGGGWGGVAPAESAGTSPVKMSSSRQLTTSLGSSRVQAIQHPLGMSK